MVFGYARYLSGRSPIRESNGNLGGSFHSPRGVKVPSTPTPSASHFDPLTVMRLAGWCGTLLPSAVSRPAGVVPGMRTTRTRICVGRPPRKRDGAGGRHDHGELLDGSDAVLRFLLELLAELCDGCASGTRSAAARSMSIRAYSRMVPVRRPFRSRSKRPPNGSGWFRRCCRSAARLC